MRDTCDGHEMHVNVEGITWLPHGDVPLVGRRIRCLEKHLAII